MIKRNPKHQKQALLNKLPTDDKDTSEIYPPFEIEECYSAVDHREYREDNESEEKDYSYYCLEKDIVKEPVIVNPYSYPYPCAVEMKNMGGWGKGSGNVGEKRVLPEKIEMNGNCYMKIGGEPQLHQEQQKIEEKENMVIFRKALCGACQTLQLIPKNSSKFVCYKCHTICSCQSPQSLNKPQAAQNEQPQQSKNSNSGLFKCGTCGVKVQYVKGSSNYIRCTRCSTVNYVPQ